MTETELQDAVIELAHLLGWRCVHFRAARTSHGWRTPLQGDGAGWPDLVLLRDRLVIAELKSAKGTVAPAQQEWLDDFARVGVEAHVWRPQDWRDGTIEAELRRRVA